MPRTHGHSDKGRRCYGSHDCGAKGRINVMGGLIGSALGAVGLLTANTDVFAY
ncbi:hypothetical protein [Holospora undulata]|uniref:Uncharacterized protein n=1 Tax=Holospora undulata HU1 TaxID=1321371 RepID=A0A061JGM8_9PROT|nr:hypothetical protein [Holospora undulata]ETZ05261.1 hypothetical protein K737_300310 [Holospora undulata HU1]